ncbi:MAG: hypothetical protein M1826_006946 [Phylliscum demangeonii]|nr:MAG: hypothetical protein M1826_006946 [Phylliscum demangeonii]
MCRRLKFAVVLVSCCLTGFATAAPAEKGSSPVPAQHPLDKYGYRQTLESDLVDRKTWIDLMGRTKSLDSVYKFHQADENGGDPETLLQSLQEQQHLDDNERTQLLKQSEEDFQHRVAEDRTRHLLHADRDFTPANDAAQSNRFSWTSSSA